MCLALLHVLKSRVVILLFATRITTGVGLSAAPTQASAITRAEPVAVGASPGGRRRLVPLRLRWFLDSRRRPRSRLWPTNRRRARLVGTRERDQRGGRGICDRAHQTARRYRFRRAGVSRSKRASDEPVRAARTPPRADRCRARRGGRRQRPARGGDARRIGDAASARSGPLPHRTRPRRPVIPSER